jgi:hypothetical protein
MPNNNTAKIKMAMGLRSVFLAAKLDTNLVGRFSHMSGQFLLDRDGTQATKRALADVMVYMAGKYEKLLSAEEVEMGLLAASHEYGELESQNIDEVPEPQSQVEPTSFLDDEPEEEAVVTMESNDTEDDFFTEDFESKSPPKPQRRGRPGVKPNDVMINAMLNSDDCLTPEDVGISTLDVALRYYNFIENELAVPESDDHVSHKVKLAIGSTMKALGWKKRMRSGKWGWHPTDDFSFGDTHAPLIDPDDVVLRKRDQLVLDPEEEEPEDITQGLPRLSKAIEKDVKDELAFPNTSDGFTDGLPERKEGSVKFVDHGEGTEDVVVKELVYDKTMTFFEDEDGHKRMLEWDAEEEIWTYHVDKEAI